MARSGPNLIPARDVAPGVVLRKELEARGWTQVDLARVLGRPEQTVSQIIRGKKQITPETALALSDALGTSAELWLNLEARYRLGVARRQGPDNAVGRRSRLYSTLPVRDLVRRGWIEETGDIDELESRVERFLQVSALDEVPDMAVAARRTATKAPDPRGLLAWIRRVQQLASGQSVGEFQPQRLRDRLPELLRLSVDPPAITRVPAALRDVGVRFVLVPHLPETYLDGAVLPDDGSPVVALSARHDRLDSFWFTLTHELAHLVCGHAGMRVEDLDAEAGGDADESEADRLAAEWLVPEVELKRFVRKVKPDFSEEAIWSFAVGLERHPAIVVGRLQHDKHVSQAYLRRSIPKIRGMLEPWMDVAKPPSEGNQRTAAVGVRESQSPYDVAGTVVEWLRQNPGWRAPAEIREALGMDRSVWARAARLLTEAGRVERTGRKRGTKYRVRSHNRGV